MPAAILILHMQLPGCASLKEKRSKIKPVLQRLRKEFNVATAEIDRQDAWQEAVIGCVTISSDAVQNQRLLQQVIEYTARTWPDLPLLNERIERC